MALTFRFKPCGCGVLEEEPCDCEVQSADLERLAARPIYLRRRTAGDQSPEKRQPETPRAEGAPPGKREYQ